MTEQLELITGGAPRPDSIGRLDETTKATGRVGVSRARAALAEATRRSAERDAARIARRDNEPPVASPRPALLPRPQAQHPPHPVAAPLPDITSRRRPLPRMPP